MESTTVTEERRETRRRPTSLDEARLRSFEEALDAVRKRVEAEIGEADVAHITKMRSLSEAFEVAGRLLIHVSLDPFTFGLGVTALWLHKQLEATEIGHTTLHGAYDGLAGAEAFQSKTFSWNIPIDEATWRHVHNVRHHGATNVAEKDPDIHFGPIRLNAQTPWSPAHLFQLPVTLLAALNFTAAINIEYSGMTDLLLGNGRASKWDFVKDDSLESWKEASTKLFRKWAPYYGKNYVFYPALAGLAFPKVLLGNYLAETMRDLYSAATIFCGHVGEETADFDEGTRSHGRGEWYAMQVAATNDFDVPLPVSILCGALDKQIEHHLFPKFPPNRLREIAPEVRAICEAQVCPTAPNRGARRLVPS
jgi:NADPH-dependent stearoyl-CoA 9-desaturase